MDRLCCVHCSDTVQWPTKASTQAEQTQPQAQRGKESRYQNHPPSHKVPNTAKLPVWLKSLQCSPWSGGQGLEEATRWRTPRKLMMVLHDVHRRINFCENLSSYPLKSCTLFCCIYCTWKLVFKKLILKDFYEPQPAWVFPSRAHDILWIFLRCDFSELKSDGYFCVPFCLVLLCILGALQRLHAHNTCLVNI